MTTIFAFLVVVNLVTLVHELGHLVAARAFGVNVRAFSLGIGPRLVGVVWRGTDYRVSALPFGGYVKLGGASLLDRPSDHTPQAGDFLSRSRFARIVIYAAGPAASIVTGLVLHGGALWGGSPLGSRMDSSMVAQVVAGSAAADAGFRAGDLIDGAGCLCSQVWELAAATIESSGPIDVHVIRRDQLITLTAKHQPGTTLEAFGLIMQPWWLLGPGQPAAAGGTALSPPPPPALSATEAFAESARVGLDIGRATADALAQTARGRPPVDSLTGPVGIAWLSGVIAAHLGWLAVFDLAGLVSLAVGFFNLVPMPPLDGGHITLLVVEGARGRDLGATAKMIFAVIGLLAMLALLVATVIWDLGRIGR